MARMEQHVNNSECFQLDIDEVEECSLAPEHADVDGEEDFKNGVKLGQKHMKSSR